MSLNIPSYVADPNYRYKMPKVIAKIEGRGNGIKTIIVNMKDVSKSLHRPAEYCTKFCGIERGAQSKYDASEGKAVVNGVHTDFELQQLVDRFIEKYVLCPNCSLPEVDMLVNKGHVRGKCNACGHSGDLDNVHKLATYILKNPPGAGDSTMGKKSEGGSKKKDRQRERSSKHHGDGSKRVDDDEEVGDDDHHHHHHHSQDNDETTTSSRKKKDSKEKRKKKDSDNDHAEEGGSKKESSSSKKKDKKSSKKKDGEDGTTSSSRRHHSSKDDAVVESDDGCEDDEGVQSKAVLSFDSTEINEVIARLVTFLNNKSSDGTAKTARDFFQEVRLLQVAQDFTPVLRVYVSLSALCQTAGGEVPPLTVNLLKEKMTFLSSICDRSVTGEMILEAFEEFIIRQSPNSLANYAHICSTLYHADLVEEDVFVKRYSMSSSTTETKKGKSEKDVIPQSSARKQCQEAVRSFIQWLEEAESASEDDDDDDDDDDDNDDED